MSRELTEIDFELGGWLSNVLDDEHDLAPEELKDCIIRWMASFGTNPLTEMWAMSADELKEMISKQNNVVNKKVTH